MMSKYLVNWEDNAKVVRYLNAVQRRVDRTGYAMALKVEDMLLGALGVDRTTAVRP